MTVMANLSVTKCENCNPEPTYLWATLQSECGGFSVENRVLAMLGGWCSLARLPSERPQCVFCDTCAIGSPLLLKEVEERPKKDGGSRK